MDRGTIICVGNFELPDKNAAAHRVIGNAKLFRQLGFETVFLGVCRGEGSFDGIVKREYAAGFDIYEQAYPETTIQWARQMFAVENVAALARRYERTVAVLLYNTQYSTLLAVKKALAKKGICVLYDCTEWNDYTEGSFIKKAVKQTDSRLIETCLPLHADGLIVVSTAMREKYGEKRPLLLLPPLVDREEPIWRQRVSHGSRFVFCYAGDPSNKDRLDLLLRAFSRLPPGAAELRIVGLSAEDAFPADGVRFMGRLSHEDTVREIACCDCFIFLRERNRRNTAGFPTKFAEAYTCGVPIITTAVSDLPLYAADDCVVLSALSRESVFAAMERMLSSPRVSPAGRGAFDYRNYIDACGRWFERIVCRKN